MKNGVALVFCILLASCASREYVKHDNREPLFDYSQVRYLKVKYDPFIYVSNDIYDNVGLCSYLVSNQFEALRIDNFFRYSKYVQNSDIAFFNSNTYRKLTQIAMSSSDLDEAQKFTKIRQDYINQHMADVVKNFDDSVDPIIKNEFIDNGMRVLLIKDVAKYNLSDCPKLYKSEDRIIELTDAKLMH